MGTVRVIGLSIISMAVPKLCCLIEHFISNVPEAKSFMHVAVFFFFFTHEETEVQSG